MTDGIEVRVARIQRNSLRALGESLLRMAGFVADLDALPRVGDVTIRDVDAQRADALERLSTLSGLGHRALAADLERLPESELVQRLRTLGATWAEIADASDMQAPGLFKRYAMGAEHRART